MGFLIFLLFLFVSSAGVLQQRAEVVGPTPAVEVAEGLRVVGVYGVRSDTTSDLKTLRVVVELGQGAHPHDLRYLLVRYSDASTVETYARTGDSGARAFDVLWIRGAGENEVMLSGDLVQLSFDLPQPLPTRTDVALSLIPEAGFATSADFRTPPTYGTDTVVTLR